MKKHLLFLILFILTNLKLYAQCGSGYSQLIIKIQPDNLPQETSWDLKDLSGNLYGIGASSGSTLCVPNNVCMLFSIYDQYGDGICCSHGNGFYKLYLNNLLIASGGVFGIQDNVYFNCVAGLVCSNPLIVDTGIYVPVKLPYWFGFKPKKRGVYEFSTCHAQNNCNTVITAYENCTHTQGNTLAGAMFYDDNGSGCGKLARATAALDTSNFLYVLVSQADTSCNNASVVFSILYKGEIHGCKDPNSCNYI